MENNTDSLTLWRFKDKEFSDAQLSLNPSKCGTYYGAIEVQFNKDELGSTVTPPSEISSLVVGSDGSRYRTVKQLWSKIRRGDFREFSSFGDSALEVIVPIGSESRIAKSLRGYPFVTKADLPIGMYGGAQREALLLKRDKFKTRKKFDKNKTRNLLRLALNQYFDSARPINCNVVTSTQKAPYKIENEKITPNGFFNTFSFDVYVDPQYTRCLAAHWDTFKLYIDIFDSVMNKKGEISASVFVEELRTVTKGGGGVPPSTLTWYKKPDGDQNEIESDAVFHLVVGMSRYLDGSCYFEAGEDYEVPEGVEQCKENAFPG